MIQTSKATASLKVTLSAKVVAEASKDHPPSPEMDDQVLVTSPSVPTLQDMASSRINLGGFQAFQASYTLPLPY